MADAHDADLGVTFCIPNWNHRTYLARSVRSALRAIDRTGLPGEIIVVDDASRDGSQRFLATTAMLLASDNLDVVLLPQNNGLAAARNLVLRRARYRYVCFLDADNELIPENFGFFTRSIVETRAAVVYGNLIKHRKSRAIGLVSNDYVHDQLYTDNYIDALTICDRDKLIRCGGFDEDLTSHEDWEMWLHLIAEGESIVFVPVCMSYYHVNPMSMVQTEKNFDHSKLHRIYNQRGNGLPVHWREKKRMYHPDFGWLR